ncbi:MAG TPA: TldD/PmbA family protein [Candidatus Hydrogenedentes bacterium]|nr:TldD/PmbA family protein [Candidatus Hydrogenedentota bacterium]HPG66665.1 TldD/PmbA family protein [Candidatus Hydrogenedentota bacterium]
MTVDTLTLLIETARQKGAAEAEAVGLDDSSLDIEVAQGIVETLSFSESKGIGLRVFTDDRRMGFAYSSRRDDDLECVVDAALANALQCAPDEHNVLPADAGTSDDDWREEEFETIPVERKVRLAQDLERRTLESDRRITHVQEAGYSDGRRAIRVVNSRGLYRIFQTAQCACWVVAAAKEDGVDAERSSEFDIQRRFDALRSDWVAQQCAERATRSLGAKPLRTRCVPVVFENRVTASLLGVLGPALTASSVLKRKSLFQDCAGERVAAAAVTIVDQNDHPDGSGRAPFDGEGAAGQRTVLVDEGRLVGFLHNAYTAHRMKTHTTANAGRGGFRSAPEVSPSCFLLEPGPRPCEDLVKEAGHGLWITGAMGVHTADAISGDFSFGVSGLMIEGGAVTGPFRGVTAAGNMKDVLARIVTPANDLRFFGAYGAPSVLVSELVVSGE